MLLFCLVFAMSLCASVYMCFVVTCWERADLLALVCGVYCESVTFPIGILGQVWYLIVSIPDLGTLTYFVYSSNFIRLSDLALDDNKTCAPSSNSLALEFIDSKPLVMISKSDTSFLSVDIFFIASLVILQKYL